jgi:hypothetical protein
MVGLASGASCTVRSTELSLPRDVMLKERGESTATVEIIDSNGATFELLAVRDGDTWLIELPGYHDL